VGRNDDGSRVKLSFSSFFFISSTALPSSAVHQKKVARYVDSLSTANMEVALKEFTSFYNRYYKSETGKQSAQWLYKQISDLIEESDADSDVSIRKFQHKWDQFSIIGKATFHLLVNIYYDNVHFSLTQIQQKNPLYIDSSYLIVARFEGKDESLSNQPVIVGAHQDSVNMWLPMLAAPGADDDGSGTVTILEVFRSLVGTGFRPQRPVEFHWYSAEEAGLLGSQDVAKQYEQKQIDVIAMIQVCRSVFLFGMLL
jgi:leucyl aminopeptidase